MLVAERLSGHACSGTIDESLTRWINAVSTIADGLRTRLWSMISTIAAILPAEGPELINTTRRTQIQYLQYSPNKIPI